MYHDSSAPLSILFVFGAFVLAIAILMDFIQKTNWRRLAQRTGLKFKPGLLFQRRHSVSGTYQGYALRLDTYTQGYEETADTYTRVKVTLKRPGQLVIYIYPGKQREESRNGTSKILLGDSVLDQRLNVYGYPSGQAVQVLTSPKVLPHLLVNQDVTIEVGPEQICCKKRGLERDVETLIERFDFLCALAAEIDTGR